MFRIVTHRKKGVCVAHGCRNKHTKKDRFCSKHRHRYNKFNNPIKYRYHKLRSHASERNIEFFLTIRQFKIFCLTTNYHKESGKSASSASVDRINPKVGYHFYNIQVLSLSNNSRKMHRDNSNTRYDEDDLPF